MKPIDRRTFLKTVPAFAARYEASALQPQPVRHTVRAGLPQLDSQTTGQWWAHDRAAKVPPIIELNVPRDQVVAFALYTHDAAC